MAKKNQPTIDFIHGKKNQPTIVFIHGNKNHLAIGFIHGNKNHPAMDLSPWQKKTNQPYALSMVTKTI
jgi:hypothetical protein